MQRQGRFRTRRARRVRGAVVLALVVPTALLVAGSAARARPLPAPVPYVKNVASAVGLSAPCGILPPLPKVGGGQWTCTFADEFDGGVLDRTKWAVQRTDQSGFHSGAECFRDDPDNVAVVNGTLQLTVEQEATPFTCTTPRGGGYTTQYTSGSVSTYQLFSQAYGRFEVRAKVPWVRVKGLQESFWLWPDNPLRYGPWPTSGEIDIAEIYSVHNTLAVPYIHYTPATYDPDVTAACSIGGLPAFHVYAAEWTPTSITISIDGRTCLVDTWRPAAPLVAPQPFDQPFMVALTQALGIGANAFVPGSTPLPATTQIDYVRVYK